MIKSNPGATVYLSGKKIGRTPLKYSLDPSYPHVIVLKQKGFEDISDVISFSSSSEMITKEYRLKYKSNKATSIASGSNDNKSIEENDKKTLNGDSYFPSLDKTFVSLSYSVENFKYFRNNQFKINSPPLNLGIGSYNFNGGWKYLYNFSSTNVDILSASILMGDESDVFSIDSSQSLMFTSHDIELGWIINYINPEAFLSPVIGLGYRFSAFRLCQSTESGAADYDNPLGKSETSGPYFLIEFFKSFNANFGVVYHIVLNLMTKKLNIGTAVRLCFYFMF